MRGLLPPLCLLVAGCAADAPESGGIDAAHRPAETARLPAALRHLVLNEGHPTALPAAFDHEFHARTAPRSSCASCHHELRENPAAIPSACTSCHLPFYLAPAVDETVDHRHDLPPDL